MSGLGTGVAAGVAAAAHTAGQVRKDRDKRVAEQIRREEEVQDTVEAKLRGLEDQDEGSEEGGGIRIDPQLNPTEHPQPADDDKHPHIDVEA